MTRQPAKQAYLSPGLVLLVPFNVHLHHADAR